MKKKFKMCCVVCLFFFTLDTKILRAAVCIRANRISNTHTHNNNNNTNTHDGRTRTTRSGDTTIVRFERPNRRSSRRESVSPSRGIDARTGQIVQDSSDVKRRRKGSDGTVDSIRFGGD